MMRNSLISETRLIDTAAREIRERLPPRWRLLEGEREAAVRFSQDSTREVDAIWEIRDPAGISSDVIIEVKRNPVEPRFVSSVVSQMRALSNSGKERVADTPACMLISTYLSPLTRERLTRAGVSYADSTGTSGSASTGPLCS